MSKKELITNFLKSNPHSSSTEIFEGANLGISYATVRRELSKLVDNGVIMVSGKVKASRYGISPIANLLQTINIGDYFQKEIDEREINNSYNSEIIPTIPSVLSIIIPIQNYF